MSLVKHLPNTITLCNLLSGCTGSVFALRGQTDVTFLCVLLSGVFDFFDGFTARLTGSYSEIGKELDSLADLISFGLAPALTFYACYHASEHTLPLLAWVPLLIAAFSALRLAKFNLDSRQTKSFIGMPTPACALLVIPLCLYGESTGGAIHSLLTSEWFIPAASIVLSALLVAEIPMLSMKKSGRRLLWFLAGAAVIIVCCIIFEPHADRWYLYPALWLSLIFVWYLLLNCTACIVAQKQ